MKRIRRMLLWGIPVALAAAGVTAVLLRESLAVRLAPKTVLRSAIVQTCDALQTRFRDDPVLEILETIGPGRSFRLQLEKEEILWNLSGDMGDGCLAAEGTVSASDKDAQLSFYLDTDALAVRSEQLTGGGWYGITFKTFSEDLGKIPLLSWILPDTQIARWQSGLTELGRWMERFPPYVPLLSEIRALDVRQLTLALAALPSETENTVITLNGHAQTCRRITLRAEGHAVEPYLSRYGDFGGDITVAASFYLLDQRLVLTDIKVQGDKVSAVIQLETGTDPLTNPLSLRWETDTLTGSVCVDSREQGSLLSEIWTFSGRNPGSVSYSYDRATGAFSLTVGDRGPIRGVYRSLEDGLRAETADFGTLWQYLTGREAGKSADAKVTITIRKQGNEIKKPHYKNPDAWTTEDFLNLMEGMGSLIGLKLQ